MCCCMFNFQHLMKICHRHIGFPNIFPKHERQWESLYSIVVKDKNKVVNKKPILDIRKDKE